MSDNRRGLLTEREREILSNEASVDDDYYYAVVSRVRGKIGELEKDATTLQSNHPALYSELESIFELKGSENPGEGENEQ